jgi:hypothetical protein
VVAAGAAGAVVAAGAAGAVVAAGAAGCAPPQADNTTNIRLASSASEIRLFCMGNLLDIASSSKVTAWIDRVEQRMNRLKSSSNAV